MSVPACVVSERKCFQATFAHCLAICRAFCVRRIGGRVRNFNGVNKRTFVRAILGIAQATRGINLAFRFFIFDYLAIAAFKTGRKTFLNTTARAFGRYCYAVACIVQHSNIKSRAENRGNYDYIQYPAKQF